MTDEAERGPPEALGGKLSNGGHATREAALDEMPTRDQRLGAPRVAPLELAPPVREHGPAALGVGRSREMGGRPGGQDSRGASGPGEVRGRAGTCSGERPPGDPDPSRIATDQAAAAEQTSMADVADGVLVLLVLALGSGIVLLSWNMTISPPLVQTRQGASRCRSESADHLGPSRKWRFFAATVHGPLGRLIIDRASRRLLGRAPGPLYTDLPNQADF
jgi:hypothetical protein